MKVRYEFEINVKESDKVLCEGCYLLDVARRSVFCPLTLEGETHHDTEKSRIDAMRYLESKCPLKEVYNV